MRGFFMLKKVINTPKRQRKRQLNIKTLVNQMFTRVFVKAEGFEPSTACLEGRCSIQLSYASIYLLKLKWKKFN